MPVMRSILAVTDLSRNSDESVRAAGALAVQTGAKLHVILTSCLLPWRAAVRALLQPQRDVRERLERLDAQLERMLPPGVMLSSRVVESRSCALAILSRARTVDADTIVLDEGTGGRARLDPTFREVVEGAAVPCLVPRGALALPFHRAVMPIRRRLVDPDSFDLACHWIAATHRGRRVPAEPTDLELLQMVRIGYEWATASRAIHHRVERLRDHPELQHAVQTRWRAIVAESAAVHMRDTARRTDAGLIVIPLGVRGAGIARRSVLGRFTRRLLANATVPVLLVPSRDFASQGAAARQQQVQPPRETVSA